jgi:hypothetical protein
MTSIIVMIVLLGGQNGPAISGWKSIAVCNAAKVQVLSFLETRHGGTSYVKPEVICMEFPNE